MRPIPPNLHQENMMEPLHGPIRSIFIRIFDADHKLPNPVAVLCAVRMSNDLYRSDFIISYEAAKGYTCPVNPSIPPLPVDPDLVETHVNLFAYRKLTRILRSHSISPSDFRTCDLIQVYVKRGKQKRVDGYHLAR